MTRSVLCATFLATLAFAQDAPANKSYRLNAGHRIPLSVIHGTGTRSAAVGDQVYLSTAFPVWADGRLLVPIGSYVMGTVTDVRRPGRIKGRAEIHIRFDTLTLPNGVMRDFRGTIAAVDGGSSDRVNRDEGSIEGKGGVSQDLRTVSQATMTGTSLGSTVGIMAGASADSNTGDPVQDVVNNSRSLMRGARTGLAVGALGGLAVGLTAVLLTRGPEVVVPGGASIEMSLDRPLEFTENELNFAGASVQNR